MHNVTDNETVLTCETCDRPIEVLSTGRPPKFCDTACRQAAYRKRRRLEREHQEAIDRSASKARSIGRDCETFGRVWAGFVDDETLEIVERARWLMVEAAERITPSRLPLS